MLLKYAEITHFLWISQNPQLRKSSFPIECVILDVKKCHHLKYLSIMIGIPNFWIKSTINLNLITYFHHSQVIVCSARCGAQHVAVALYGAQMRCTPLALQAVLSSEGLNAAAELLQMQQRTEQMLLEQFGA